MSSAEVDVLVVGGGFFGCHVALHARACGLTARLVEREDRLLGRASRVNQARVHQGYHYPRSVLTGLRSRVNFGRFVADYPECIDSTFKKYYAVAQHLSHVNARQFAQFCQRIGAPLRTAPDSVRKWFARDMIEEVWEVEECAFDADRLAARMRLELDRAGVPVDLATTASVTAAGESRAVTRLTGAPGRAEEVASRWVINCTYSAINRMLDEVGGTRIPLKLELAEMVLVQVPEFFQQVGLTVMCGPFFSVMPYPSRGLHTLSHVRYTPHCSWQIRPGVEPAAEVALTPGTDPRPSHYAHMIRDVVRYFPALAECRPVESLWELKTVLPQSEHDDSRPILFRQDAAHPAVVSVMGGKLDNIYDLPAELDRLWRSS